MNKFFILIAVLLLIVLGFYFIKKGGVKEKSLSSKGGVSDGLENKGNLKITKSQVSYAVDKVFFRKPVEKIIGTTGDLNGSLNYEKGLISAYLIIPTLNLKTGQDKRDEDVRQLIGEQIKVEVKNQSLNFPYENKMPASITIMGVTNEVTFDVVAKDENGVLSFSGSSIISMKSFGVKAPSMLDVYQSSDEVILSFEIKAEK